MDDFVGSGGRTQIREQEREGILTTSSTDFGFAF